MMEHEVDCPWLASQEDASLAVHAIKKPCEVRKCAVWRDLYVWFGYSAQRLSKMAFEEIFRDVAHGGSG